MTSDRALVIFLLLAITACIAAFLLARAQLIGATANYTIVLAGFAPLLVYASVTKPGGPRRRLLEFAAQAVGALLIAAALTAAATVLLRIGWLRTWRAAWSTALDLAPFCLLFAPLLQADVVGAAVLGFLRVPGARRRPRQRRREAIKPPLGSSPPRGTPRGTSP